MHAQVLPVTTCVTSAQFPTFHTLFPLLTMSSFPSSDLYFFFNLSIPWALPCSLFLLFFFPLSFPFSSLRILSNSYSHNTHFHSCYLLLHHYSHRSPLTSQEVCSSTEIAHKRTQEKSKLLNTILTTSDSLVRTPTCVRTVYVVWNCRYWSRPHYLSLLNYLPSSFLFTSVILCSSLTLLCYAALLLSSHLYTPLL